MKSTTPPATTYSEMIGRLWHRIWAPVCIAFVVWLFWPLGSSIVTSIVNPPPPAIHYGRLSPPTTVDPPGSPGAELRRMAELPYTPDTRDLGALLRRAGMGDQAAMDELTGGPSGRSGARP